ncbi:DinB family protein [Winogradskyella sp. UBA3174]|uniref:DinB family protein n=1 Tax=Winogradskyella sp. UBA3174 TaxID=1947785 RepID=UPI0025F8504E|nr:DinB family protein [Winogradskyella sp. UBA3174]|tara:strand:- start:10114 stop:10665 length:552 start_codon:yes stop_codon:yes gene_type:complete
MKSYLDSSIKQFEYYKSLGDKTISQLSFEELKKEFAEDSNSVSIIVKHIVGNMLSRWTNFLTEDGEKEWRKRDEEFEDTFRSKEDLIEAWNKGWNCLFEALNPLSIDDLEQVIFIRNQGHTVTETINRQMMHYAYHIGQIVFLGKLVKGKDWQSLSIAKGNSKNYNKDKFSKAKGLRHFTEDL